MKETKRVRKRENERERERTKEIDRDPTRVRVAGNLTVWNKYHDVGYFFRCNNLNVWLTNTGGERSESHLHFWVITLILGKQTVFCLAFTVPFSYVRVGVRTGVYV